MFSPVISWSSHRLCNPFCQSESHNYSSTGKGSLRVIPRVLFFLFVGISVSLVEKWNWFYFASRMSCSRSRPTLEHFTRMVISLAFVSDHGLIMREVRVVSRARAHSAVRSPTLTGAGNWPHRKTSSTLRKIAFLSRLSFLFPLRLFNDGAYTGRRAAQQTTKALSYGLHPMAVLYFPLWTNPRETKPYNEGTSAWAWWNI